MGEAQSSEGAQEEGRAEEIVPGVEPPDDCEEPHPWRTYQGNAFVDRAKLLTLLRRTWELDQREAEPWKLRELEAISALVKRGEALPPAAKHRLWRGVSDSWKNLVWTAASGASALSTAATKEDYERALTSAFGHHIPESFERCPLFDGSGAQESQGKESLAMRVHFTDLLNSRGVEAAQRLLWCCSQLWSGQVEYCPVVPALVVLLLVYFESEAEVYAVVAAVLARATEEAETRAKARKEWERKELTPFPLLPHTLSQWEEVANLTANLAKTNMPMVDDRMGCLGVDLEDVALRALNNGLLSRLPFRAVCRAYGAFLGEGTEVFVRILLAHWEQQQPRLELARSKAAAEALLLPSLQEANVAEVPRRVTSPNSKEDSQEEGSPSHGLGLGVDDLVRGALRIQIPKTLAGFVSDERKDDEEDEDEMEQYLSPKTRARRKSTADEQAVVFCRPRLRTDTNSNIIWDELWSYLWQWLPPLCRIRDPVLTFAAHRDGYTMSTLLAKCHKSAEDVPMLLAAQVCSKEGTKAVIGVFLPTALRATGSHYGDISASANHGVFAADSYVFRVVGGGASHGAPKAWHWSGKNGLLLRAPASGSESLCVGGDSVSFSLDQSLGSGSTAASASFDSPTLLPAPATKEGAEDGSSPKPCMESIEYTVLDVEVFGLD